MTRDNKKKALANKYRTRGSGPSQEVYVNNSWSLIDSIVDSVSIMSSLISDAVSHSYETSSYDSGSYDLGGSSDCGGSDCGGD